jgi:hypothetical protein
MSGIEIYVKDEQEKAQLIQDYLAPDDLYLKALDALKEEMIRQGADLDTKEGKRQFILAVREMNAQFGTELHKELHRSPLP